MGQLKDQSSMGKRRSAKNDLSSRSVLLREYVHKIILLKSIIRIRHTIVVVDEDEPAEEEGSKGSSTRPSRRQTAFDAA